MGIIYKVLVLLVAISTGKTVCGATSFHCHGDICNKGTEDQFCSETFQLCRNCEEVVQDCGTNNEPADCANFCSGYMIKLALEKQKEANCSALNTNFPSDALVTKAEYKQGETITIDCSPGYEPYYTNTAQCGQYGSFHISPPTCAVQTCVLSPLVANARFIPNLDTKTRATINTTVNVECKDGFTLFGSKTMTCLGNNTWNVAAPFCVPSRYIWWHDFAIVLMTLCGIQLFVILLCVLVYCCLHRETKIEETTETVRLRSESPAEIVIDDLENKEQHRGEEKRYSDYSSGSEGCGAYQPIPTAPPYDIRNEDNTRNQNITNVGTTINVYGNVSSHSDGSKQATKNDDEKTNEKSDDKQTVGRKTPVGNCTEESQITVHALQETQQDKCSKGAIPITLDNDADKYVIALDTVPQLLKKKLKN